MLTPQEFKKKFDDCLKEIAKHLPESSLRLLGKHNRGYRRHNWSFYRYYTIEYMDYYRAYAAAVHYAKDGARICDCGGFIGAFALIMAELGYEVCIVEAIKYYGNAFDDLYRFLSEKGIVIIDYDMFDTNSFIDEKYCGFDIVYSMAVIEHYPYSHKRYMANLARIADGGYKYLMAPNIAFWYKRVNFFFKGITPLADIKEKYYSSIPFTGHHHEMTVEEMKKLISYANGRILEISFNVNNIMGRSIEKSIAVWVMNHFPETRENITIIYR